MLYEKSDMNKRSNLQEEIEKEIDIRVKKEIAKKNKKNQIMNILLVFVMTIVLNNLNISAENSYSSNEVSYDNTNSSGLTSPNVQGALDGLYQAATDYNDLKTNKADKSATVSNVAWDSTNKKLTKTINGSTTDIVTGATILGGLTSSQVTTALGYTPPTTDTNTWRGVQNNLTSTSTSDCLSAAQGKALNDNKAAKSATVSTVAWDSTNKKLTKTINGSTTDVVTGATILGGLTKSQVTTALGYTPPTSDTNTWRGVQNNLTSTSTSDCLSAAQGKALNDSKAPISSPNFSGTVKFGGTTFQGMFAREGKVQDNVSINSGNVYSATLSATKSGYTPVAISDCRVENASSSGTGSSYVNFYYYTMGVSGSTCNVYINARNTYSGTVKVKFVCNCLFVKNV